VTVKLDVAAGHARTIRTNARPRAELFAGGDTEEPQLTTRSVRNFKTIRGLRLRDPETP